MRNNPQKETDAAATNGIDLGLAEPRLDARALNLIRQYLPPGWSIDLIEAAAAGDTRPDTILAVHATDGTIGRMALEVKRTSSGSATSLVAQARALRDDTGLPVLLVVDYANPVLRQECERNDVSYIDMTGWIRLRLDMPAVFLQAPGAPRDPRPPRETSINRLDGKGAGRVVRGLLDGGEPMRVRALAGQVDVSPGTVAKVLATLAREDVIERSPNGVVTRVRRRALLDRWTRDYSFLRSNGPVRRYVAPRGLPTLLARLQGDQAVVCTGSFAGRALLPADVAPVTPLTQMALLSDEPIEVAARLGLVPSTAAAANVLLAIPYDPSLIDEATVTADGVRVVGSRGQVLADLLTLPGRAPEEAEQLIDALSISDEAWR